MSVRSAQVRGFDGIAGSKRLRVALIVLGLIIASSIVRTDALRREGAQHERVEQAARLELVQALATGLLDAASALNAAVASAAADLSPVPEPAIDGDPQKIARLRSVLERSPFTAIDVVGPSGAVMLSIEGSRRRPHPPAPNTATVRLHRSLATIDGSQAGELVATVPFDELSKTLAHASSLGVISVSTLDGRSLAGVEGAAPGISIDIRPDDLEHRGPMEAGITSDSLGGQVAFALVPSLPWMVTITTDRVVDRFVRPSLVFVDGLLLAVGWTSILLVLR